jgi:hypothetical protein
MNDTRGALDRAIANLLGQPPAPFVKGAGLELVTRAADRFVRGVVVVAGQGAAQLDISNPHDGVGPRTNLIAYDDIVRIRETTRGLPNGNWGHQHPDRRRAEALGRHAWWTWSWPR